MNITISSLIAGLSQTIIGHPLDTIKTRVQYNNSSTLKEIKKIKNIKYLYKGSYYPLIGNSILNSFLFSYHYNINKKIDNHFLTGLSTGIISGLILSPCELIKCKLQMNKKIKIRENLNKSLFNGMSLCILRESIGLSLYFGIYEYLQKKKENSLLNGGLCGLISWTLTYPIDIIKTKKQIDNEKISKIIKKMNILDYKIGLEITLIRSIIVNSSIFYIYENLNNYLEE
tara:strand:+ start:668 stop:1354 length:687 start_codon:yes stop_codon:yes gene_type:complete